MLQLNWAQLEEHHSSETTATIANEPFSEPEKHKPGQNMNDSIIPELTLRLKWPSVNNQNHINYS